MWRFFNRMIKHVDFNLTSLSTAVLIGFIAIFQSGCYRGRPSEKPPIHVNPNMDKQTKYTAQSKSNFFENHSAMRTPVDGTISRGNIREDTAYYQGKDKKGDFVTQPLKVDLKLLTRGQERYNIYCTVCHGETGEGDGIITQRGLLPPPSFHEERLREKKDGYFFDIITNGKGNMQSYRHQVPVPDRWAIISYIRALQKSQSASLVDLPEIERKKLKQ